MVRVNGSPDAGLHLLLASPDPVLLVLGEGDEPIVASNAAARRLFDVAAGELEQRSLRAILPDVEARTLAVDALGGLELGAFARVWARIGDGFETVSIGAARVSTSNLPFIAVFLRSESGRLREPADAGISEARLRFALDSANIGDWNLDLRTNKAFRSRIHDACFGYTIPPVEWTYETFLAHVHSGDREPVSRAFDSGLAGEGEYDVEFRAVWPDGSVHWLWTKGAFYHDATGKPVRVAGIVVDIDARKQLEERSRLSALAMDATVDAIVITDARAPDHPIVYVNASFEELTGYSRAEVIGKNCRFLQGGETAQGGDSAQPESAEIREALEAGRATRVTLRNYRKDGELFWNQLTLSPVRDEAGSLTHYVGVQTDITRAKALEADLLHRATHDALTGLPNRQFLEEWLARALEDAARSRSLVAVAFLDVDRLKIVNDSIGHEGGDALLALVANRLNAATRSGDLVARFGGDEFMIVMRDLEQIEEAERSIGEIREALMEPYVLAGIEIIPSASIGIAIYPNDASDVLEIIRAADTAMYAAKSERGMLRFFDRLQMHLATDRISAESALRRALLSGELALEYQPIFDARSGRIASLEALLRWDDPERGTIAPNNFIPLAEESGLIVPMGVWVLREIARQMRAWERAGATLVPIALNVSIAQLRRHDFVASVRAIVAETGIDPKWLVLEMTESMVMDNAERFFEMLAELRRDGFRISIDDFGTGFSSLSYLKRLSLDSLKIDKSFLSDVVFDPTAAAICRAVVTLAHSVGMTTIAEGVETAEQAAFLRAIGCDELQGFYLGRPARPEVASKLLLVEPASA